MNAGYLYMIAALLSFSTLGMFHKLADVKHCRPATINALIYCWSLVLSFGVVTVGRQTTMAAPREVLWIALPFGVCASIAILALQAGLRHGDIATSWLAINLSSGIPTVASILIYGEPLNGQQIFALSLIPVSMAFLWVDKRRHDRAAPERVAAEAVAREDAH